MSYTRLGCYQNTNGKTGGFEKILLWMWWIRLESDKRANEFLDNCSPEITFTMSDSVTLRTRKFIRFICTTPIKLMQVWRVNYRNALLQRKQMVVWVNGLNCFGIIGWCRVDHVIRYLERLKILVIWCTLQCVQKCERIICIGLWLTSICDQWRPTPRKAKYVSIRQNIDAISQLETYTFEQMFPRRT